MERQYYYKSLSTNYRLVIIFLLLCISIKGYSQTYQFFSTRNYHTQLRLNTKPVKYIKSKMTGKVGWCIQSQRLMEKIFIGIRFILQEICGPLSC